MSRTQWVGTTTTGGLSPLKAQGGNSIESVKGYRGFTRIMSHMDLKEWPSSSLMHTQGKIRHKGKCVRACVCVWAREREKSPVPLSKVAIINGEHRTGYRWLPCTAIPPCGFSSNQFALYQISTSPWPRFSRLTAVWRHTGESSRCTHQSTDTLLYTI